MVLEGFPEADRDKIVECVRSERGEGKVKNLTFKWALDFYALNDH